MKRFKIGLQLFTVREAMKNDFYGTLKAIKDMGYEYVEPASFFGKTAEEFRAALDEIGLKCVSVHQAITAYEENAQEKIDYLKALGIKYAVFPWYHGSRVTNPDEWHLVFSDLNYYGKLFYDNGLVLGYHNHDFEFRKFDGKYAMDAILENVKEEYIVPEFDVCWTTYAGADTPALIRKYSGRVPIVHIKDFYSSKFNAGAVYDLIDKTGEAKSAKNADEEIVFECRPIGKGVLDLAPILEACEDAGTEILIVEQDNMSLGLSELESVRISREYLKETFGI